MGLCGKNLQNIPLWVTSAQGHGHGGWWKILKISNIYFSFSQTLWSPQSQNLVQRYIVARPFRPCHFDWPPPKVTVTEGVHIASTMSHLSYVSFVLRPLSLRIVITTIFTTTSHCFYVSILLLSLVLRLAITTAFLEFCSISATSHCNYDR